MNYNLLRWSLKRLAVGGFFAWRGIIIYSVGVWNLAPCLHTMQEHCIIIYSVGVWNPSNLPEAELLTRIIIYSVGVWNNLLAFALPRPYQIIIYSVGVWNFIDGIGLMGEVVDYNLLRWSLKLVRMCIWKAAPTSL